MLPVDLRIYDRLLSSPRCHRRWRHDPTEHAQASAGRAQGAAIADHAQRVCAGRRSQARADSSSYEEFLLALVDQERDVRRQRRIERALRASHLPLDKTLETFERKRLPRKIDTLVNVLIEGSFLDRCENVLAFGQPGSGKTHLLCAIGLELIYAERRVLFRRCDVLVQELLAAKRDLILPRLLKQWGRFDALHRRPRLRAAQPRGDGSAVQPAGAPLRAR